MKTLKFTSQDKDIDVEYLVDLIGSAEPFTIYDVTQYVSGVPQWGLNGEAITFGMYDKNQMDKTVSSNGATHTFYTLTEFVAFAVAKNLTLIVIEDGETSVTKNTLTSLAFTTEALDAAVCGVKQLEVVTFSVAAEAQIETITVPATTSAAQGDYFVVTNVAGTTFAAWLDIDDNGTAPTGAAYVAADEKIEVNIATGGTAAVNAAAVKAAIELNGNWAGITIVDNLDGTLEFTQTVKGDVADTEVHNTGDTGAGSISAAVDNDGVDGALQGDYILMGNALTQETAAIWLNIDGDDTTPTGALYVAADYKIEVAILSGDTAAEVAATAVVAIGLSDWSTEITLTDNEDGTVDFQQDYAGVIAEAVPKDADDSGAGTITSSSTAVGTVGTAYSFTIEAEGGNTPYIFTTESTLPEGISLSTAGILSGTPREDGTFTITVTVTDYFGLTVDLEDVDLVVTETA